MGILKLFIVALMPVLKTILVTGIGLLLALDRIKLLGPEANQHLNNIVFYVLSPSLIASNLAETITFRSFLTLWFMPVNLFLTFVLGSALAWLLIKITKTPKHLQGIIIGCCSSGNTGNLLLIMIPAACQEPQGPFGDPSVCSASGKSYVALSMAVGAFLVWTYVFGIMRIYANKSIENGSSEGVIPSTNPQISQADHSSQDQSYGGRTTKMSVLKKIKLISAKLNLKRVFAPSAIAAMVGFIIGSVSPLRKLMIGNTAPLRVIDSSASLVGMATVPCMTLIMGANLLRGLKGSDVSRSVIMGIIGVRCIFLPMLGIGVVKGAKHLGIIGSDSLFQYVLMLQYAVPPAMAIGTMTQYFQLGQCEYAVIMLWAYAVAAITLTVWSTLFMWLLA